MLGRLIAIGLLLQASNAAGGGITVLEPDGVDDRVPQGREYSVYELHDPWDMSGPEDLILTESRNVSDETFADGVYSAISTKADPNIWLAFAGLPSAYNQLESGQMTPIDTSLYQFMTIRIRVSAAPGFPPLAGNQSLQVLWFEDQFGVRDSELGCTRFFGVTPGDWRVVQIDLVNNQFSSTCGGANTINRPWQDWPLVRGLRLDPVAARDVLFEIDYVRLHAAGADTGSTKTITWTGGSGPYDVVAIDGSNNQFPLAEGVVGTSLEADLATLPAGDYAVEVSDDGQTGLSSGNLMINDTPFLNIIEPDVLGDLENRYSVVEVGNPWSEMDMNDVDQTNQLTDIVYEDGILKARTTGGDPFVRFVTPIPIDTAFYRMMSYRLMLDGERSIGGGSVARLLWGVDVNTALTGDDIVVQAGTNDYDIGDMKRLELEGGGPPGPSDQWNGLVSYFRIDPHEFQVAKDIELSDVSLAPLDSANPLFTIEWASFDSDDDALIDLYLDPDTDPQSGGEIQIADDFLEADGLGTHLLKIGMNATAPEGEYYVYAEATDGLNTTFAYSSGPLLVGPANTLGITVLDPDGVGDELEPAPDFATDQFDDRWEMDNPEDVDLSFGNTIRNLADASFENGYFSARSTSNDPGFYVLHPQNPTRPGLTNTIDTSVYRYLAVKIRHDSPDPQLFSALYFEDQTLNAGRFGFTNGVIVKEGDWRFLLIDLVTQNGNGSPNTWASIPQVAGLRIDPSSQNNVSFEIDWIQLVPAPTADTLRTFDWTTDELGPVTLGVRMWDRDNARITLVTELDPATTTYDHNLYFLPPGEYIAEVFTNTGVSGFADGPIAIMDNVVVGELPIFGNGFEGNDTPP